MKRFKLLLDAAQSERNRIAFKGGSYSLAITAIVLAILVVVNILATALPASVTRYDISASKLYSITSNTKTVVNALEAVSYTHLPHRPGHRVRLLLGTRGLGPAKARL